MRDELFVANKKYSMYNRQIFKGLLYKKKYSVLKKNNNFQFKDILIPIISAVAYEDIIDFIDDVGLPAIGNNSEIVKSKWKENKIQEQWNTLIYKL